MDPMDRLAEIALAAINGRMWAAYEGMAFGFIVGLFVGGLSVWAWVQ